MSTWPRLKLLTFLCLNFLFGRHTSLVWPWSLEQSQIPINWSFRRYLFIEFSGQTWKNKVWKLLLTIALKLEKRKTNSYNKMFIIKAKFTIVIAPKPPKCSRNWLPARTMIMRGSTCSSPWLNISLLRLSPPISNRSSLFSFKDSHPARPPSMSRACWCFSLCLSSRMEDLPWSRWLTVYSLVCLVWCVTLWL